MIYELVKIGHIISVVLWIGCAFTTPLAVILIEKTGPTGSSAMVRVLRAAYLRVAGPAIIATWVFGITLLSLGQWFDAQWMIAKLVVVLFLSGLHGALSGKLKKLAGDSGPVPRGFFVVLLVLHLTGLMVAVCLVVLQP